MAMMTVQDRLDQAAARTVVGRDRELEALAACLEPDGPIVTFVHGIPGVGKSALLQAFSPVAKNRGARVVRIEGGSVEPSEGGFLDAVGQELGTAVTSAHDVSSVDIEPHSMLLLVIDDYDELRLLDSWLRRVFVLALPHNARIVAAGRYPPSSAWLTEPGWHQLVRAVRLDHLAPEAALSLLRDMGVEEEQAGRIQEFAKGHPLALKLAMATALELSSSPRETGIPDVVQELSQRFLNSVEDPVTREALVVASVIRKTTVSVLEDLFPEEDARTLHDRLAELPFVSSGSEGLEVQAAVRDAIAGATRAHNPERYKRYRRRAWRLLESRVGAAGRAEFWRYTADLLYLIENPNVREAFFPSDAPQLSVEPAREGDLDAILEIAAEHDGPETVDLLRRAWRMQPGHFHVVRDSDGTVVGFYHLMRGDEAGDLAAEPVFEGWLGHLAQAGAGIEIEEVLFLRRWLAREQGDAPSAIQAACWLDVKRTYMEMRPNLRRVYIVAGSLAPYAAAAEDLGFRRAPELDRMLDGRDYQTAWLDFGPSSVDGWLSRLAAAELGVEDDPVVDRVPLGTDGPRHGDLVPDLLDRIRSRKVGQWGLAYVAAAWLLLEGIGVVADTWGWSASVQRGLQLTLAAGLPLTIVLAWYHGERGRQNVGRAEILVLTIIVGSVVGLLALLS